MTGVRLDASIHGVVQGVGFRIFVFEAARSLGIGGWVANASGGTVRVVAEGDRTSLERLLADLERGPAGAVVERVGSAWMPATGEFGEFSIRSGWHGGD
jgi:acylphosphatase